MYQYYSSKKSGFKKVIRCSRRSCPQVKVDAILDDSNLKIFIPVCSAPLHLAVALQDHVNVLFEARDHKYSAIFKPLFFHGLEL